MLLLVDQELFKHIFQWKLTSERRWRRFDPRLMADDQEEDRWKEEQTKSNKHRQIDQKLGLLSNLARDKHSDKQRAERISNLTRSQCSRLLVKTPGVKRAACDRRRTASWFLHQQVSASPEARTHDASMKTHMYPQTHRIIQMFRWRWATSVAKSCSPVCGVGFKISRVQTFLKRHVWCRDFFF